MANPANIPISTGESHPFDVVIIGGGILGLTTACELLASGYSTAIVDDAPENSATSASGGMLSPFLEECPSAVQHELLLEAYLSYPAFVRNIEKTIGCRIEMHFTGTLYIDPLATKSLEELTYQFREIGANASYLSPSTLLQEEPSLETGDSGAILLPDEGYVDPRQLHQCLRAAFEHLGGIWKREQALEIECAANQVVGVRTSFGQVPACSVFCAAGAAGGQFLTEEDRAKYAPTPVRGEIVRLRPRRRQDRIRHVVQARNVYLVPQENGTVLVGATSYPNDGIRRTTGEGIRTLLENAREVAPISDEWEFVEAWNGIRPMAQGGVPHLVDDVRPGLFHGLGLYRHGILLGPTLGARMARRVAAYLFQSGKRKELLG